MASARTERGSVQETAVVKKSRQTSRMGNLIDDYLAHCSAEGVKRRTIEGSYGYPLKKVFLPFCDAQGIPPRPDGDEVARTRPAHDDPIKIRVGTR